MRKWIAATLFLGCSFSLLAQNETAPMVNDNSIVEKLLKSEIGTDKFRLTLHTKGSFNAYLPDGTFSEGKFRMDQLRIDMRGDLNKHLYYRYQQRLTSFPNPSTIDNLALKIDYAGVGYRFNEKIKIFAGKMCTAYGGFEFDDNPINVYQYSILHENMTSFLAGLDFAYLITPDHELRFQVLDSRNLSMEETYGLIPSDIHSSKVDLVYTLNWNGSFGPEKIFSTRWSASILNEAKNTNMYYGVLGTAITLPKFNMFLDLMYSREQLDRKRILSREFAEEHNNKETLKDVDYSSIILGLNYRFCPKWNFFAKGIYDTASKYKASHNIQKGTYQRSWGYSSGIEFFPIENENLHLNLAYTGRNTNFTTKGKALGAQNYTENKIELSFIYAIKLF